MSTTIGGTDLLASLPDEPAGDVTPKLLYVGGWGRSGSTLLARLLGEHPDMVFIGELRDTWFRGVAENRLCGCGEPFLDCVFWSEVGEQAFGGWDTLPLEKMVQLRATIDKPWRVPGYAKDKVAASVAADTQLYVALLGRLTRAVARVVGPDRWIIDSSKLASFAWLLDRVEGTDVRTVHLVRDARGSVWSWQKSIQVDDLPDQTNPMMLRYSPASASARYVLYNRQADGLARLPGGYVRTRYEDLVTEPERELDRICDRLDLGPWDAGQLKDGKIKLGSSHSVVGNPMRMHTGWMPLRPDTAWRQKMPAGSRRMVTAITSTALRRYGYLDT